MSHWNYNYIFDRLNQYCLKQNVSVISINQMYTSQRCNCCGYVHSNNRKKDLFKCIKCNFTDNADLNASKNILIVNELYPIPEFIKQEKHNRSFGFYWLNDYVESLKPSITQK